MKSSILFILIMNFAVFSAQKYSLRGNVKDPDGFGVDYTIVTFTDRENKNFETTTNSEGNYSIILPLGNYRVQFDAVGFALVNKELKLDKDQTLNVVLGNTRELEEVAVTGEKPLYRFELDKKVYDVAEDVTARGGSLSDVLQNVPSVSVDVDGTVNLRGSSNVKFLINGKPTSMLGISNTADVLRTIPSSDIEKIEVITNPSSRYEAEGTAGILNIVMKKNSDLGFNGNIQSNIGYRLQTGLNANLNWNKEKWGYYINPGVNYRENYGENSVEMKYLNATADAIAYTTQNAERVRSPLSVNIATGAHYDFSKQSVLSAGIAYRTNDMTNTNDLYYYDYLGDGSLFDIVNRYEVEDEKDHQFQGNLDFEHSFNEEGKKLSIGLNLQTSGETEIADLTETSQHEEQSLQRSTNLEDQNRVILTADYVNPFKKGANFELGYMGKFTHNTNDFNVQNFEDGQWFYNEAFTDGIGYKENIQAFYTQYGNTYGKFSYQLGLRSETSEIRVSSRVGNSEVKKNYTNVFPTAFLNYNFSENTQFQINYSRRIQRPRGRFLNPFFTFADDRNTFRGNPDLNPSYTHSLELGMNLKLGPNLSFYPQLYYRNTQDDISVYVQQQEIEVGDNVQQVLVAQPYNVGTQNSYGTELSFQYKPFKWWKMFGEVTFFGYEQKGDKEVFNYNAKDHSWRGRYSSTFTLPKNIDFQIQTNYRGKMTNGQSLRKEVFVMNLGLSKDVLKNNATLTFNVQDLFNSRKMRIYTAEPTFERNLEMQWRVRTFNLSFTYRFNQKKKRPRDGDREGGGDDGGMGF